MRRWFRCCVGSACLVAPLLLAPGAGDVASARPDDPRLQSERPLIGASYTHYSNRACSMEGTGIIADGARFRLKVKDQLAAMRAAGIESLRLLLWHSHDSGGGWGVVSSARGRLDEPYRRNLIHYLSDARAAGFKQLTLAFGPIGANNPIRNTPNGIVGGYDPKLFDENWSFIRDVRPLVKKYGPASVHFDLNSEGVPGPGDPADLAQAADDYLTRMYGKYVDAFGNGDVTVSFVGLVSPTDAAARVNKLVADLRASGRPLPGWYMVHPSYGPDALAELRAVDRALAQNGLTEQPLVMGEGAYNEPAVARAIATYDATSSRPVSEVIEWPLTADRPCKDISVSAPYRADAYITALTGAPPSTTLRVKVISSKQVALKTPNGNPVIALEEGQYTLAVTDASSTASFHLIGSGLDRSTSGHFQGTTTWSAALRPGTYRYGSGRTHSKLRGHFVVLATDQPEQDVALGMPATASRESQYPASNAVDGLAETSWGAGDLAPQWIKVDLGAAHSIGRLRLIVAQSPAGDTVHRVWGVGSLPGDQERLLYEFAGPTTDSQVLEYAPPKPWENVRYVRVETVKSLSWVGWREIEVFAR